MRRKHHILAVVLLLLFVGWGFNAYACLIPLFGVSPLEMERGCATPDQQSSRQFCEAFKTLGIKGATEIREPQDASLAIPAEVSPVTASFSDPVFWLPNHEGVTPPLALERFITTIVLRL